MCYIRHDLVRYKEVVCLIRVFDDNIQKHSAVISLAAYLLLAPPSLLISPYFSTVLSTQCFFDASHRRQDRQ
jgi:hypothetical protein